MKIVKASEFKARCLQFIEEVSKIGEPLVITKKGVPISQLVPYRQEPSTLFGALKGSITVKSDILAPIENNWEVLD